MALRYRSVFTKTESPASLDRIAKGLRPPAVKLYLARSRSARPLQHSSLVDLSVFPSMSLASPRLRSLVARTRSLLPLQLCVDHSHYPCSCQLPSCVAVYPRDARLRRVLYRFSKSLVVSRSLPLARPLPHGFTGHVARPSRSIRLG